MSRSCASGALLVGGEHRLPEDPCEFNTDAGCNQLHCGNCGERVRNSPSGFRLADSRGRADAPALYAAEDWSASPLVVPAAASVRLYACRCDYWHERDTSLVVNDHEEPGDPHMNWACGGHPEPALPLTLGELAISTETVWPVVVGRILDGACPRPLERADEGPWLWLVWLYVYLRDLPAASGLSREVGRRIGDRDERTVGAVLIFFQRFPTADGIEHLLAHAKADPSSVAVKHSVPEDSYEPSMWDVLIGVLVKRTAENPAHDAVDVIRKVMLHPIGRRDPLVQTLERSWEAAAFRLDDAAWFAENIVALDAAGPGRWKPLMNQVVAFARNDDELESMIVIAGVALIESGRIPAPEIREWIKQHGYDTEAWPLVLQSALDKT